MPVNSESLVEPIEGIPIETKSNDILDNTAEVLIVDNTDTVLELTHSLEQEQPESEEKNVPEAASKEVFIAEPEEVFVADTEEKEVSIAESEEKERPKVLSIANDEKLDNDIFENMKPLIDDYSNEINNFYQKYATKCKLLIEQAIFYVESGLVKSHRELAGFIPEPYSSLVFLIAGFVLAKLLLRLCAKHSVVYTFKETDENKGIQKKLTEMDTIIQDLALKVKDSKESLGVRVTEVDLHMGEFLNTTKKIKEGKNISSFQ